MDLSKLSDADLQALNSGDLSKVSDEGLQYLNDNHPGDQNTASAPAPASANGPVEPSIGTKIAGGVKTAYDYVGQPIVEAGKYAVSHPVATAETALGASYIPGVNNLPILRDIKNMRMTAQKVAQGASEYSGRPGFGFTPPSTPAPAAPPVETGTANNFLSRMANLGKQYSNQAVNAVRTGVGNVAETVAPVARAVAPYAKPAGVGITAAVTPGNVGQNYSSQFPTKGPYAGSEINPMTGRPWTPQELAQYR